MKNMPRVVSAMTPFPTTIEVGATLHSAKLLMYEAEIRHLPVVQDGKLVGLLSDRDLKLALAVTKGNKSDQELLVGDACNFETYVVDHEERLDLVLAYMAKHRIGSTLITKGNKLVGIFTNTDACRMLEEMLRIAYPDA